MNFGEFNFGSAAIITYIGYALRSIPNRISSFIVERFAFTLQVNSNDVRSFLRLSNFLMKQKSAKILRNNIGWISEEHKEDFKIKTNTIAYGNYAFFIDKFTLANVSLSQRQSGDDNNSWRASAAIDYLKIRLFGLHQTKYKNIIIKELNKKEEKKKDTISIFRNDNYVNEFSKRDFDTVFFKEKDRLINYVNSFINNKEMYRSFGYSSKTGILLYGVPGTGKSSIAKCIASYLGWTLRSMELSSFPSSSSMLECLNRVSRESVVLFEDIDVFMTSRKDTNKKQDPLLGTLLNYLDGVTSPDDVIFIATTNYVDRLDDALIRNGRFDLKIELKNLDRNLAVEMCKRYEAPLSLIENESFPINPAYLQNKIFTYVKNDRFNNKTIYLNEVASDISSNPPKYLEKPIANPGEFNKRSGIARGFAKLR